MTRKIWIMGIIVIFLVSIVPTALAMNKAELVEAIASNADLTIADASGADSFFDIFTEISARNIRRTKRVKYSNIVLKRGFSVFSPDDDGNIPQMNKAELIEAIASSVNLTKADTERALDAFIGATTKSLKGGKRVALVGFGSFSISKRKARTGRNPQAVVNGAVNSGLELVRGTVKFKAGDRPFLPNVEYTTTEDIATEMVSMSLSGNIGKGQDLTEDQARQFIDSFTNVILSTLQTGIAVNVGEDFGTFSLPGNVKIHETKNGKTIRMPPIGHVDHGKGRSSATIQIPAKKVVKFKAGADLAKTVA